MEDRLIAVSPNKAGPQHPIYTFFPQLVDPFLPRTRPLAEQPSEPGLQ